MQSMRMFLNELTEKGESVCKSLNIIFWKIKINQHRISKGIQIFFILINNLIKYYLPYVPLLLIRTDSMISIQTVSTWKLLYNRSRYRNQFVFGNLI